MERLLVIAFVIGVCLVLSFLFSGMEAGVLALSRLRIRQLMRAGNQKARVLLNYLDTPENFLWTIFVGNTVTNFVAVSLLVMLLHEWLARWPVALLAAFLAFIFLFYAFCELLPKMLFRMFPNRLTLALAGPFRVIHLMLSPLVAVVTKLTQLFFSGADGNAFTGLLFGSREEMRLVMQESAQGLTSEERVMINRVLDLQNIRVRDVAIPMDQVMTITTQTPMGEALRILRETQYSRLPVWQQEDKGRRIVGVVSVRTVMYQAEVDANRLAADYLKPALYLGDDMRLEAALKRMQRSGHRLGVVLGRDQREVGVVSLQDILKVIFGEVRL